MQLNAVVLPAPLGPISATILPSLVGVAGLSACVHADEHYIVIGVALVKAVGLDTEIDQLIVDPSAVKVFDGVGGTAVGPRQKQYLFFRRFRRRGKGRRCRRKISHDGFDRLRKGHLFDLNEIVQRRIAADPTGKPAPFAVGDLQAVVLTGAVGAAPEMHQLLRLISPQIGQQIHLTGSRHHLRLDIWHMFHLRSDIKIAEGVSK